MTWTFAVARTNFFPATRSMNAQKELEQNPVTRKFASQRCVYIPKAKVRMDKHLTVSILEDISQQQSKESRKAISTSSSEFGD